MQHACFAGPTPPPPPHPALKVYCCLGSPLPCCRTGRQPQPEVSTYDAFLFAYFLPQPLQTGPYSYCSSAMAYALGACMPLSQPSNTFASCTSTWGAPAVNGHKRDDDCETEGLLAGAASRAPLWLRSLFLRAG